MHVVLVGPELEENLTLRYLRGALEADGHRVSQVDFEFARDVERAAKELCDLAPDVAGFSMVFTRRAEEFAALIRRVRALGFRGVTIAGGHFAAFHAEQLLGDLPELDLVGIGEGEDMMRALAGDARTLRRDPEALAAIPGLVFREGDTLRRNAPAVPPEDLDVLPWPVHRRPYDRYMGLPIVNMLGSRGCTHSCGFCSIAAWHKLCGGSRYRVRSPKDIAAEMGCLYRDGVRVFNFHDDNFLGRDREANLARYRALRSELAAQGVGKIAFQIKARPDSVDEELFAMLRSMGLFRVFLGIEAGTEVSLKNLGRGQKLDDNVRALGILNGLDLHVAFNLLVLNPESTFEDLEGNVAFLRAHLDNPMNFCRTEIYQGTPLEKRLRKRDRLFGDYWGLDYAIADQRAQRAFELFRDAFFQRNFGAHPLHYLSGQVDYEHQLRMDFFGTTPELRAMAKGFIRRVNANTVGHLEDVLAEVRRGGDGDEFKRALFGRVHADDERLHALGQRTLSRIRDLTEVVTRRPFLRGKGGIAIAAAVALASCRPPETAPMEAAPPPPPTSTGAPPEPDSGWFIAPPGQSLDAGFDAVALADAIANGQPYDAGQTKPVKDAGVKAPPTVTAPMEAAPPPPPHHMEAAPLWKK